MGTTFHTLDIRKSVDSEQILVRKCQESLAEWYLVVWKSATDNFLRFWRHNSECLKNLDENYVFIVKKKSNFQILIFSIILHF